MSTIKHFGYAVCEHDSAIVPITSYFDSKQYALSVLPDFVLRSTGLTVTYSELFPCSQEEQVRELVDALSSDSHGFTVLDVVELVPNFNRDFEADLKAHYSAPTTCCGLDASQCVTLLASWGIPARMSKAGHVWAHAPADDDSLRAKGLRYSKKRGLWWITPTGPGDELPRSCKLRDFLAAEQAARNAA